MGLRGRARGKRGLSQMKRLVVTVLLALPLAVVGEAVPAQTPVQMVERSVKALANTDTQVGLYFNVREDCTSGPLPTIRLVSPPSSGKVIVKSAKAKMTNYKACLAIEVPAYLAIYKSAPDFLGADTMTIEVSFPGGRTEIQKITVNVSGAGAQQKI
jgi:hypothetical protein